MKVAKGEARVDVPSGEGYAAALGAAYLMTDEGYVAVSGDKKKLVTITLKPKPSTKLSAKQLGERFLAEWATQKVRWAITRNNQPIREFITEQAVLLANGHEPAASEPETPAADVLTTEQRSEIEKLIAEVEEEIKVMNEKKTLSDPKGIKASWEEKQEKKP